MPASVIEPGFAYATDEFIAFFSTRDSAGPEKHHAKTINE